MPNPVDLIISQAVWPEFTVAYDIDTGATVYRIKPNVDADWVVVDRQTYLDAMDTVRFTVEMLTRMEVE